MKLIFAIVHDQDALKVTDALNSDGYSVTKLCSTGGFLRAGNTTLLIGAEDAQINTIIEIIKKHSKCRKEQIQYPAPAGSFYLPYSTEVTVGGATIFVTNVERFEKV